MEDLFVGKLRLYENLKKTKQITVDIKLEAAFLHHANKAISVKHFIYFAIYCEN